MIALLHIKYTGGFLMKIILTDELKERLSADDISSISQLIERLDYNRIINKVFDENTYEIFDKIYEDCFEGIGFSIEEDNTIIVGQFIHKNILTYDYRTDEFKIYGLNQNESLHPDDERVDIYTVEDFFNGDTELFEYSENDKLSDEQVEEDLKDIVDNCLWDVFINENQLDIKNTIYHNTLRRLGYELKEYGISYHISDSDSTIFLSNEDKLELWMYC